MLFKHMYENLSYQLEKCPGHITGHLAHQLVLNTLWRNVNKSFKVDGMYSILLFKNYVDASA